MKATTLVLAALLACSSAAYISDLTDRQVPESPSNYPCGPGIPLGATISHECFEDRYYRCVHCGWQLIFCPPCTVWDDARHQCVSDDGGVTRAPPTTRGPTPPHSTEAPTSVKPPTRQTTVPTVTESPVTRPSTGSPACGDHDVGDLWPVEGKCDHFWHCGPDGAHEKECASTPGGGNLWWNDELKVCDWPSNVDCPWAKPTERPTTNAPTTPSEGTTENPPVSSCGDHNVGDMWPVQGKCDHFWHCGPDGAHDKECPLSPEGGRLWWNDLLKTCDWPRNVDCQWDNKPTGAPTSSAPAEETTTAGSPGISCGDHSVGDLWPVEGLCDHFWHCGPDGAHNKECPLSPEGGRLWWNDKLKTCDWPRNVDCPWESKPTEAPVTTEKPTERTTEEPTTEKTTTEGSSTQETTTEGSSTQETTTGSPAAETTTEGSAVVSCGDHAIDELWPVEGKCDHFWQCGPEGAVEKECPLASEGKRLWWNNDAKVCDWPENVNCPWG